MDSASNAIGILQFVLSCFSQIQLAREFENEFEVYQLKLDLIQLRLSRWGEVAKLNNYSTVTREGQPTSNDGYETPGVPAGDPVIAVLREIRATVTKAQRDAKKNKNNTAVDQDQPLDADACIPVDLRGVHNRLKGFLIRRTSQTTNVVDSLKWAFYKRDHFDRFITDIASLTDTLESLLTEGDKQRLLELSNDECKGINKPNLEELKDIAQDCDPSIEKAADEALKNARGGVNYVTQSHNTGNVMGVNNGNYNVSGTHYWGRS